MGEEVRCKYRHGYENSLGLAKCHQQTYGWVGWYLLLAPVASQRSTGNSNNVELGVKRDFYCCLPVITSGQCFQFSDARDSKIGEYSVTSKKTAALAALHHNKLKWINYDLFILCVTRSHQYGMASDAQYINKRWPPLIVHTEDPASVFCPNSMFDSKKLYLQFWQDQI